MPKAALRRSMALGFGVGGVGSWLLGALAHRLEERRYSEPTTSRPYTIIVQGRHDAREPAALLFALHAYATAPEVLVRGYFLRLFAVERRGVVLVVPEGLRDASGNYAWNASRACCGDGPSRPNDLGYLRGVLSDVERRYAIDRARVAALGVSNGGFMAHRWACCVDSPLTAFASISGAAPHRDDPPCTPTRPVSVLQIHGDADELVHYHGGRMREGNAYPSARDSIAPFLRVAGLHGAPRMDRSRSALLGSLRREEWAARGVRVALWTVEGGSHQLRTPRARVPEILDFLFAHEPRPR